MANGTTSKTEKDWKDYFALLKFTKGGGGDGEVPLRVVVVCISFTN